MFPWRITQGSLDLDSTESPTVENNTRKIKDHTLKTEEGFFMFADTKNARPGSKAVTSTPLLGNMCFPILRLIMVFIQFLVCQ